MPRSRSLPAALTALAVAATVALTAATTAPASTDTHAASRVRQTAKLTMHPQIAQTGSTVKSSSGALSSMTATFKPARKGRVVALQRKKAGRWITVARKRQDRGGRAEFNAPFKVRGKVAVYRAMTAKKGALARKASAKVSANKWGGADFVEEFANPATLATSGSTWQHRIQNYSLAAQRQCSKSSPSAATVTGGAARLSVLDDPDRNDSTTPLIGDRCDPVSQAGSTSYQYRLNGHISTEGQVAVRYGYIAARVKFQARRGQHGSFWMQPDLNIPSDDPGAEIDVIEWFGEKHPQGGLTSFAYKEHPESGQNTKYGGFIPGPSRFGTGWAGQYHVFSVEWTPSAYVFRIDGKETHRITDRNAISQRHEYLILSLLSSDYELQFHQGPLAEHMYVDWVKYWAR